MTAYILCLALLEHLVTSASPRRMDREDGGAVQMFGRNCHFMLRIGGKGKLHNREKKNCSTSNLCCSNSELLSLLTTLVPRIKCLVDLLMAPVPSDGSAHRSKHDLVGVSGLEVRGGCVDLNCPKSSFSSFQSR